jgi:serine/threonine-protein kinase TNNI3K
VRFVGFCLEPLSIVTELSPVGSLYDALYHLTDPRVEAGMTDGRVKTRIAVGVADGMSFLHASGVTHADLKPHNVLLWNDFTPKISDFGLSVVRFVAQSSSAVVATGAVGTCVYMAPELVHGEAAPTPECDVYSFGVLLNELVSEDQPFAHAFRTGRLAGRGPLAAAELACRGERPHISDTTPSAIAEVVRACWAPVPADRPSFERVAVLLRDIDFPSRVDA